MHVLRFHGVNNMLVPVSSTFVCNTDFSYDILFETKFDIVLYISLCELLQVSCFMFGHCQISLSKFGHAPAQYIQRWRTQRASVFNYTAKYRDTNAIRRIICTDIYCMFTTLTQRVNTSNLRAHNLLLNPFLYVDHTGRTAYCVLRNTPRN